MIPATSEIKMYSNDKNSQYMIAMLKAYGIRYVVASPGGQNIAFNAGVLSDSFFRCYSVIDERSAAYLATGIAEETGEPVVITCTGSTSSRNYLPAMTEAFYRKLPIIAITGTHVSNKYNQEPQFVDRTVTQNDVKVISVDIPVIKDDSDKFKALSLMHAALTSVRRGPVHINLPNVWADALNISTQCLPDDVHAVDVITGDTLNVNDIAKQMAGKNIGIFIGSHKKFSERELDAISGFAQRFNAPVFCDHSSRYNGKNKILTAQIADMLDLPQCPDIMIDIGNVSAEYSSGRLFWGIKIWRISPDGNYCGRFHAPVFKLFDMSEIFFFEHMMAANIKTLPYYGQLKTLLDGIKYPDLPLSNALISQKMAEFMPHGSAIHLTSNCRRNMNFFNLDNSIDTFLNVGVCGIDGSVSTMVGHSLMNPDRLYFVQLGDLAFFYDMNILGNRHIGKNLRILVINNNGGQEFRLYPEFRDKREMIDNIIAASGHNRGGACGWAKSCGFVYMSASDKSEFLDKIRTFCTGEFDAPVLFEVFTTDADEKRGLEMMRTFNKTTVPGAGKKKTKLNMVKKLFKRGQ